MSSPFDQIMQNPRIYAIKKFMATILEHRYPPYDDIISRTSHNLVTDADMNNFSKMISSVYEAGYMKAVAEYKEQLAKLGIKVNVNQKTLDGSQK